MVEDDLEVEALESIFGDDLSIIKREDRVILEMNVHPLESALHSPPTIRVTIEIGSNYPSVPPEVRLWQPRGVDEKNVNELNRQIEVFVNSSVDMPILYDIFRKVQEYLEDVQECPSAVCPICLNDFTTQQPSIRTHCDHYIHQPCFATYVDYSRNEVQRELAEWPDDMKHKVDQAIRCPMCREVLEDEECAKADGCEGWERWQATNIYEFDWNNWRETQRTWDILLERQRINGGLIDLDEERHRFLITDDTVLETTVNPAPIAMDEQTERRNEINEVRTSTTHSHRRRNRRPLRGSMRDCGMLTEGVGEASKLPEACENVTSSSCTNGVCRSRGDAVQNHNGVSYRQNSSKMTDAVEMLQQPKTSHSKRTIRSPPGFEDVNPHPSRIASTDITGV
uniref:E3 ubiquitin-protein ligase RNF25 n=1 Tax=Ascaris suum TaxID=6253 RepID=F1L8X5_ASCSU